MLFLQMQTGISKVRIGLQKSTEGQDELLTALNCFATIFSLTGQKYEGLVQCAIGMLKEEGIKVVWNKRTKRFERGNA